MRTTSVQRIQNRAGRDHSRFTRAWNTTPTQTAKLRHTNLRVHANKMMLWTCASTGEARVEWDYGTAKCTNKKCACHSGYISLLLLTEARWIGRIRSRMKLEEYRMPGHSNTAVTNKHIALNMNFLILKSR